MVSSQVFHFIKKNRVVQNLFKKRSPIDCPPKFPIIDSQPLQSEENGLQFLQPPRDLFLFEMIKGDTRDFLEPMGSNSDNQMGFSVSCPTSTEAIVYEDSMKFVKLERTQDVQGNSQLKRDLPQRKPEKKNSESCSNEPKSKERTHLDPESEAATTTSLHANFMEKINLVDESGSKKAKATQRHRSPRRNHLTVNTGPRYGYRGEESSDGSPYSAGAHCISRNSLFFLVDLRNWVFKVQ